MIQSMANKNYNPDVTYPCFTPNLILNQSDISHPSITAYSNPLYVIARNSIAPHDVPQAFSVYRMEIFHKVRKLRVQTRPPFIFLL